MKTSNTTTFDVQKKAAKFDFRGLIQIITIASSISIVAVLLYKNIYLWSIGIIVFTFASVRIHQLHKEIVNIDWSVDLSDFSMEDVMADLEGHSFEKRNIPEIDMKQNAPKTAPKAIASNVSHTFEIVVQGLHQ